VTVSAARERIKEESQKATHARIISTTGNAALSFATEDGESHWLELDDRQVWELCGDAFYYLQRIEAMRRLRGGNSA
jgi:hypothetical protein